MPNTMQQPNLGYGQPTEATVDQVNQWMRSQPWYQQLLKSWGQDPNNVHLNDAQKQQIVRQAQANGVVVDEGNMEVDPSGNFNPKGHKLRNTLIVAGLAAATIGTMGAAGAFTGPAMAGTLAGGGGAASAAGTAGTLAGIEGGAAGLSSGALAGLGTGAMGATALPALGAAGAAGAGAAGATGAAWGADGAFLGPSTYTGATGGSSILGTLGKVAANKGGAMLTNAAAGMGNERMQNNYADQNAAIANNRANLDAATFNRDLPSVQARQVARGDLLSTMQNTPLTGDPRIDKFSGGGLRPSAFGPDTRAAGDALKRQALQNLLSGGGKLTPQSVNPQRAGFGENALAGAGIGLNILDAYNRWGQ